MCSRDWQLVGTFLLLLLADAFAGCPQRMGGLVSRLEVAQLFVRFKLLVVPQETPRLAERDDDFLRDLHLVILVGSSTVAWLVGVNELSVSSCPRMNYTVLLLSTQYVVVIGRCDDVHWFSPLTCGSTCAFLAATCTTQQCYSSFVAIFHGLSHLGFYDCFFVSFHSMDLLVSSFVMLVQCVGCCG